MLLYDYGQIQKIFEKNSVPELLAKPWCLLSGDNTEKKSLFFVK